MRGWICVVLLLVSGCGAEIAGRPVAPPNRAVLDAQGTAEVLRQVDAAVATVFSYDYRTLPANRRAAEQVITGEFVAEFDRLFAQVRALAPQQQAVVSATVAGSAVQELRPSRAQVLLFTDHAVRSARGPSTTRGRIVVSAARVDGRWKIAGVLPLGAGARSPEVGRSALDPVLTAAADAATVLNTVDARAVEQSFDRWERVATGPLLAELQAGRGRYAQRATAAGTSSEATVLAAGITGYDPAAGTATLLLALDVEYGDDARPVTGQRLRMELTRTAEGWKVSSLAPA